MRMARPAAPLVGLLLSGCTSLLHSTAPPEQTYYLRPPAQPTPDAGAPLAASLRLGHVTASPGLDSPHIMLVQPDHRMDFYARSRWPAAAPEVIESLAVQTLRASGVWSSVEDSTSPFPSEYLLQVVVRRFEADYASAGTAPSVQVTFDCIVGRRAGREVVAAFTASGSETARANRLGEVLAAFEAASSVALQSLAQQTAQAVRADLQRRSQNAENPDASSKR
jgi:cholesterol transport system auxiliary component